MSSLELIIQSVQGARCAESTDHRENRSVPDHFRVTVQQGNWLRDHRGFHLDQQWMQWNLQSGILYRYCFGPPNTKDLHRKLKKKNFRENKSTCIIFLTWLMKWAFFLFLLINQSAKKLPVLFNKDKVKVNSRLCRSQIWSLSVYYKWVLSQRVFIIFLNTSFAHTVRIIKISWTLFPLVFYDHLCQS